MLIAVGAGTVTFIGIVFSLLFLVVQFASTTFTPRLNLFRDDPIVWRAFAFYTAVVVYSLTAALVIGRDEKTSAVVPIIAFVAMLAVDHRVPAVADGRVHVDPARLRPGPDRAPRPRSHRRPLRTESAGHQCHRRARSRKPRSHGRRSSAGDPLAPAARGGPSHRCAACPARGGACPRGRRIQGGIRRDDRRRGDPGRHQATDGSRARAGGLEGAHRRRRANVRAGSGVCTPVARGHRAEGPVTCRE